MTIRTRTLPSLKLVAWLGLLLAGAVVAAARQHPVDATAERPASITLSLALADQGNRALQAIREDSRAAIRAWTLPELPGPEPLTLAKSS